MTMLDERRSASEAGPLAPAEGAAPRERPAPAAPMRHAADDPLSAQSFGLAALVFLVLAAGLLLYLRMGDVRRERASASRQDDDESWRALARDPAPAQEPLPPRPAPRPDASTPAVLSPAAPAADGGSADEGRHAAGRIKPVIRDNRGIQYRRDRRTGELTLIVDPFPEDAHKTRTTSAKPKKKGG